MPLAQEERHGDQKQIGILTVFANQERFGSL